MHILVPTAKNCFWFLVWFGVLVCFFWPGILNLFIILLIPVFFESWNNDLLLVLISFQVVHIQLFQFICMTVTWTFKDKCLIPFSSSSLILKFLSKSLRALILWKSKQRDNPLRGYERWAIVEVRRKVASTVLSVSDPSQVFGTD